MSQTILPITEPVASVCTLLYDVVGKFIATSRNTHPPLGKYEAEVEALNLFKIAIRNVEGVIELARRDLVLLPPALAAARTSFETAVKAAWLVNADDPFHREVRWLAHLASEESYLSRIAKQLEKLGKDVTALHQRETSIKDFRLAVDAKLPRDITRLSSTPTFKAMLTDLGGDQLYSYYMLLSQYVHGEHPGTWLYRAGGLGTEKRIGEFIKPADWFIPLRLSFLSLSHPGRVFLVRVGGEAEQFLSEDIRQKIEDQISKIGQDASTHHLISSAFES